MGRIRTVKPELFDHEDLYHLEKETGLPIRIAFIGLFTQCDREGRFKWRPERLKIRIIPYDDAEFSHVLDALASRGLVVPYEIDSVKYGCIPTWHTHQSINNRETASEIPEPIDINGQLSALVTREPRDIDLVKRKGKEGKGKEGDICRSEDATAISKDDLLNALAKYNELAESVGLSEVQKFTNERRRKLKARLKEHGPAGWDIALENVRQSLFLRGDPGPWRADFDFLMSPTKLLKVIEGGYNHNGNSPVATGPGPGWEEFPDD